VVRGDDLKIRFDVTDGNRDIAVAYQGVLPDLFREGQGVVAEGALDSGGLFDADTILAKHDENYMPKELKDAMAKVEYGSTQVNRSGETLHQIVDAVKGVAAVVSEISNACSEQALAIDNVNSAVTSVDMVTQSNAAQSEELSSTAKQLLSNSAELEAMVSSFRIDGGGKTSSAQIAVRTVVHGKLVTRQAG